MRNSRGVSLVEMCVAAVLFGIVAVGFFSAFRRGLDLYQNIKLVRLELNQIRILMTRLSPEIRNAVPVPGFEFQLNEQKMSFHTTWGRERGIQFLQYERQTTPSGETLLGRSLEDTTGFHTTTHRTFRLPVPFYWEACCEGEGSAWVRVWTKPLPPAQIRLTAYSPRTLKIYQRVVDLPGANVEGAHGPV